ncbi:hypothetical protein [Streptomyces sp. Tu102]|uniref:hypothetical protein n=1 Tax=Streptomyces sp. Tu102 TaxID=2838019 RepID=UPI001BDCFD5D|nr:hypothetical protein [Streptomyces sp. Tu102]MBT1090323.1 hypothetical protein [Streptomyces sp. Tu102]
MTNRQHPPDLQRLRYMPGQLLRARDLRDQLAMDAEVRWWHHRAVHPALGVADGMGVDLTDDRRSVRIRPGAAYDRRGRELLLPEPVTLPLPGTAAVLVARHGPSGVTVAWHTGDVDDPCGSVILARLVYDHERAPRLSAGAAARLGRSGPRLAFGTTPEDGTGWEIWETPATAVGKLGPLGIQVTIDASAAGFSSPPCYFAWLRWRVSQAPAGFAPLIRTADSYLEDSGPDGFRFRVVLWPRPRQLTAPSLLGLAHAQRLSVAWLGIGRQEETHADDPIEGT